MVREIELSINGQTRRLKIDETASLLEALRNHLELKAAKYGCGAGQCGTCAVIVDGEERPA